MDTESARIALEDYHSSQGYRPQDQYQNVVSADGRYLGPYIPYIGRSYFDSKPKVLIYAMAQNLARAPGLLKEWLGKPDEGLLRQYYDQATAHIHVYPYDNGHLRIIAALTLSLHPETAIEATQNIDDLVAITNFVKFSFYRKSRSGSPLDSNPPRSIYDIMWRCYSSYEIELLQPDIIIGVGNDVAAALVRGLSQDGKRNIVVKIPFPGRLNLNSRWVPKGNRLIRNQNYDPEPVRAYLASLLAGTPDSEGVIRRAIETDWYYFKEMKAYLTKQLARCS